MSIYDYSPATIAARVGTEVDTAYNSMGVPIYMTNNFWFEDVSRGAAMCRSPEHGDIYTRISNPTNNELAKAMAALERCEMGLVFSTGTAAVSTLAFALLKAGDHILCDNATYSSTNYFFTNLLDRFGVETTLTDFANPGIVRNSMRPNTRLLFFETPCNPTLKIIDIEEIAGLAKSGGAISAVDSTFATPFITRPADLGIDIVMHSSTKYICGHGDALGGVLTGPSEYMEIIMDAGLKNIGAAASPFNSFLMLRGLKTLKLRMDYHCKMAGAVAEFLLSHPKIDRVYYPGLKTHKGHETAKKQMSDFGGLLTFELKGGMDAGVSLMNNLKLCVRAVSLGEANTLVQHPASMTHWYVPKEVRMESGVTDGLVRFSAGLESVDDILADLKNTLELV